MAEGKMIFEIISKQCPVCGHTETIYPNACKIHKIFLEPVGGKDDYDNLKAGLYHCPKCAEEGKDY